MSKLNPFAPVVCPTCGLSFRSSDAPYRLVSGPPVNDVRLARFLGVDKAELPPLLEPRPSNTSTANGRWHAMFSGTMDPRGGGGCPVCPGCHLDLPDVLLGGEGRIETLVVFGAVNAGKSTLIGALLRCLEEWYGSNYGFSVQDLKAFSVREMRYVGSRKLWWERYGQYMFGSSPRVPPKTAAGDQNADLRIPLVYRLNFGRGRRVVDLIIFDRAGEDLVDPTSVARYAAYARRASAIFLLVDPTRFEGVRDRMTAGDRQRYPVSQNPLAEPAAVVGRITEMFRRPKASFGPGIATPRDEAVDQAPYDDADLDADGQRRRSPAGAMAPVLQGAGVWAVEAAAPLIQQAKQSLLAQHVHTRDVNRVAERETSYGQELANAVAGISQDDAEALRISDNEAEADESTNARREQARQRLAAARQSVQAAYHMASMTVDRKTLDDWTRKALASTAMDRGTIRVWDDIAPQLVDRNGNKVFGTDADSEYGQQLARQVRRQQIEDLQLDDARQEILSKRTAKRGMREVVDTYQAAAANAAKTGQPLTWSTFTPNAQKIIDKVMKDDPEAGHMLQNEVMSLIVADANAANIGNKALVDQMVEAKGGDFMAGKMTPEQDEQFLRALVKIHGGDQAAEAMQRLRNWSKSNAWGTTTPETLKTLQDQVANGGLDDPNFPKVLQSMAEAKQIGEGDSVHWFQQWLSRQSSNENPSHPINVAVSSSLGQLSQQIENGMLARQPGGLAAYNPHEQPALRQLIESRQVAAKDAFLKQAFTLTNSPDFKKLPDLPTKLQKISELADSIAKGQGGFSAEESQRWQADEERKLTEQEKAKPKPVTVAFQPRTPVAAVGDLVQRGSTATAGLSDQDVAKGEQALTSYRPALTGQDVDTYAPPQPLGERYTMLNTSTVEYEPRSWKDVFLGNPMKVVNKPPTLGQSIADLIYYYKSEANGTNRVSLDGSQTAVEMEEQRDKIRRESLTHFAAIQQEARALDESLTSGNTPEKYKAILAKADDARTLSPEEWRLLAYMHNQLAQLGMLRQLAGWSPEEVKSLGKDAWRTHRMFMDDDDLYANGGSVMKSLGLTKDEIDAFRVAQRRMVAEAVHQQH